jgi:ubiquinone/menaquinone biosynthesis C-methylase UbiE
MKKDTSWEAAADWYDSYLSAPDTYQAQVIWPNVKRLLSPIREKDIVDIGCGSGYFSRLLVEEGALVSGADSSPSLIASAKKSVKGATFNVADAAVLPWSSGRFDNAILISAIENMEHPADVLKEAARVLKPSARLLIVMNHPAFRVPQASSWGFDERQDVQYRRIDSYMSERREKFILHPGLKDGAYTLNYHRPLQAYFKMLKNAGFAVMNMEEWTSHKKSGLGRRANAEDRARNEFPLFLCLVAQKLK